MSEQENVNAIQLGEKVEDEGANAANNSDNGLQPPHPAEKASPQAAEVKKTPVKRTPSKRMSFIERAQKESEELVKTMGGSLELEGGRRTRSSTRGTPSRTPVQATPPPAKKARNTTPVSSGGSNSGTPTPKARGRARKLNITSPPKTPEKEEEPSSAEDNTKTEQVVETESAVEVKNSVVLVDDPVKATECKESAIPAVDEIENAKENAKVIENATKVAESAKIEQVTAASPEKSTTTVKEVSAIDGVTLSVSKTVAEPESKVEDTIKNTDSIKLVKSASDNKIESKDEVHSSTEKKDKTVTVVITKEVCTKKTNHLQSEDVAAVEPPESVMEVDETPDIVTESEAPKNVVTTVQEKVEVPIAIITNEESSVEKLHIIDENGTDFASETTNEIPVAIQKELTPEPMEVDAVPKQQQQQQQKPQQQKPQQQSQNLLSSLVTIEDAPEENDEVKKVVENNVTATTTTERVKSPISLSQKDAIKESFERGATQENELKIKLKSLPTYGKTTTGDLGEKVVANVHNESKKANDYCEPQIAISPSIATANDEAVSTPQFCN